MDKIAIRTEVYTRILLEKTLNEFSFNDFVLRDKWVPKENLENFLTTYPKGIVHVIGGSPGDQIVKSRKNLVLGEFQVKIGYQRALADVDDTVLIDSLVDFVEELEFVCRTMIGSASGYSFDRIEYMKDPNGVPFDFIRIDTLSTFEAYFTVSYLKVLPGA